MQPRLVWMSAVGPLAVGLAHAGAGVVDRMAEIGITVSHVVEQPEPGQANAEEATLLGVQRGALVTRIDRRILAGERLSCAIDLSNPLKIFFLSATLDSQVIRPTYSEIVALPGC